MGDGRLVASVVGGAVLLLALPALAGGWAVTTFDQLPSEFRAGQTYTLGYTVRQHGQTPIEVKGTEVVARSEDGTTLRFPGRPEGAVGHHVVEVSFPEPGRWTWEVVQGGFGSQELGTITVHPASASSAEPVGQGAAVPSTDSALTLLRLLLPGLSLLALAAFVLQLAAFLRSRPGVPQG